MENPQGVPPLIPPVIAPPLLGKPARRSRGAPALYAIIAFKLLKGALLLLAAFVVYNMAGLDLQREFTRLIQQANLDVEGKLLNGMAHWLDSVTPGNVRMLATGTVLYSIFSFVEGGGLMARANWAGWMAIGESAIFVPIEMYQTWQRFSFTLLAILLLNVVIVWYLWVNRRRLFSHHHYFED